MADASCFFGCVYCAEAFPNENELRVHVKMIHPSQPFDSKPAPIPARERGKTATAAISRKIPLSEVNRHCIPRDCWVAINGKVYDLTEFADRHPGGPSIVLKQAGKDASKMYNDIHKGVKIDNYIRPEAFLGELGIDENLMSDDFWHQLREARIEELKGEIHRIKTDTFGGGPTPARSQSMNCLLQTIVDQRVKSQLEYLETQKRAALDAENLTKAQEVKGRIDKLLSDANVMRPGQENKPTGGIPLSEVARHNKPHDCWIAIKDVVYDLTEVALHNEEQRKNVLAWAGRDASNIFDRIPGRFPSKGWLEMYMRPEWKLGEVGPEPHIDPKIDELHRLEAELSRLMGPSKEDIAAAQAPAKSAGLPTSGAQTEEARFPKLAEVRGTRELPAFTRAEVAQHKAPTDAYMIIHNKVYDLSKLLGSHPGGDDVLLGLAGQDATNQFELFEHSEKSRLRRDKDMLIGELIPAEHTNWGDEAVAGLDGATTQGVTSEWMLYARYKAIDLCMAFPVWYAYRTHQTWKPLSKLMYSRLLRHLHFIMAAGIFGALGSVQAARYADGAAKKRLLLIHKQTGIAMFLALLVRIWARLTSGIPPRFPGKPMVQFVETQSLRAFYVLLFVIPASGILNEYYLKYAKGDETENSKNAKTAINVHVIVGRFFEYLWLPFHLGYTTAYHWSNGRGVVKKVSPFI